MNDRPILFSGAMVRALLAGTKTQTRRVLRDQPANNEPVGGGICDPERLAEHPYCWLNGFDGSIVRPINHPPSWLPGDRLWVREAHYLTDNGDNECVVYAADDASVKAHKAEVANLKRSYPGAHWDHHLRLRPSIHMPRWASRITLIVTEVRVQRLQEITEADALCEGVNSECLNENTGEREPWGPMALMNFAILWDSLNAIRGFGWEANPWVIVTTFTVHRENIDSLDAALEDARREEAERERHEEEMREIENREMEEHFRRHPHG